MLDAGWELASHTITHADLTAVDSAQLEREVAGSRQILKRRFGVPVNNFCYPAGSYDDTVISAVRAAGYVGAESEVPGLATRGPPVRPQPDRDPAERRAAGVHQQAARRGGRVAVRWRERSGVRWLEAELPGARAAFSSRARRGQRFALREPQPRAAHRGPGGRARTGLRLTAALGIDPELVLIGRQVHGSEVIRHEGPKAPRRLPRAGAGAPGGRRAGCRRRRARAPGARGRLPAGGARGRRWHRDDPLWLARAGGRDRGAGGGGDAAPWRRRWVPASDRAATRSTSRCSPPSRSSAPRWRPTGCSTCEWSRDSCWSAPGVEEIEVCELCTSCNPDLFFSHRRDNGRTGDRPASSGLATAGQASQPAATKALQPAYTRSAGEAGCGRIRASSDHRSPSAPWEDVGGGVQRCPA